MSHPHTYQEGIIHKAILAIFGTALIASLFVIRQQKQLTAQVSVDLPKDDSITDNFSMERLRELGIQNFHSN